MQQTSLPARVALIAAVVAGVSYMASWDLPLSQTASLTWKGAGVALLAVHAALRARGPDGWLICAVMAFGAAGDVLLGAAGLVTGAVAFLVGHLIAIWLYMRNRPSEVAPSRWLFAAVLVPATVALAFLLPSDRAGAPGVALYALGLALMAATAWISRFPRRMTGIGAVMFVVSDLLIFAREGPLAGQAWVGFGIWGLYFAGQVLICLGVTRTLARDAAEHDRLDDRVPPETPKP
ncbi:lysoplasmalogenase family protein [Phenylobacterium sp. LH3H17]|uniref:lysoplasmalogenase n=1 Tax=Phenylobacterium sp. LH3H17 TaxID=2903901 RepID=UPI0020C9582D|nr:lysoplasmalogenase family protein [Phenylobacterium sp. LH3H17]UTP40946.1 lysoplasmalogenase family protein [Phenylobacterium sp. LH3H17]